jgi:hypothetical protein
MKPWTWNSGRLLHPVAATDAQQNTAAGISRPVRGPLHQRQRRYPLEKDWVNVSTVCAGDHMGLEEVDDGVWNVYKLGRFLERHRRIEDAYGRLLRSQSVLPMSPDSFVTYVPGCSKGH